MGSWGALAGGERLGAAVFPFGAGVPGQTLMAVQWARELRPTAFYGTPSYALHFAETARREGIDPRGLGFRILFFSGEPGAGIPATKALIEETFGGICVDMGSMAEMTPVDDQRRVPPPHRHAPLAGPRLHPGLRPRDVPAPCRTAPRARRSTRTSSAPRSR